MHRPLTAIIAATLLVAGCSSTEAGVSVRQSDSLGEAPAPERPSAPGETVPDTQVSNLPVGDFGSGGFPLDPNKAPQPYDQFLIAALTDIEAFWSTAYPEAFGVPYVPLQGGVYPNYPGRDPAEVPSGCGQFGDYADVEGNAFYCSQGDFVVYDDSFLFPQFSAEHGTAVIGVILAHEWGHAIQGTDRQEILGDFRTTTTELQADCYAGAWVAHVARGEAQGFTFSDSEIIAGLSGMIAIGDAPGTTGESTPGAHGSAFDRVSSFQDGFLQGVTRCVDYQINEPQPLQFSFSEEELNRPNPSDAPMDDAFWNELLVPDLERYWDATLAANGVTWTKPTFVLFVDADVAPSCPGLDESQVRSNIFYCAGNNSIIVDEDLARKFHAAAGDFSVGYLVGLAYADQVQDSIGSTLAGEPRALFNDCLVGSWAADILPDPSATDQLLVLSPGDLDEAVNTALLISDPSQDDNVRGGAFEKIDAFRNGVLGGLNACQNLHL